jgi:trans-aconitate methyltransferase
VLRLIKGFGQRIISFWRCLSDNGIIASQNAANIKNVAQEFMSAIAQHRHWNRTLNEIKPPVQQAAVSDRIVIGS